MISRENKPRVLFFGNPDFVITVPEHLQRSGYEIIGVVTSPDEPQGRNHILTPPPVKAWAEKNNIPIFQPSKITKELWSSLAIPEANLFVVASYGKILPEWLINTPAYKTLNIHPSLLPLYRGPSPIQSALLNGDQETGVSIMVLDKEMDHGPILAQEAIAISENDNSHTLKQKAFERGSGLLIEILPRWTLGTLKAKVQDHQKATYTHIIKKEDGHIDWNKKSQSILNHIRAYDPWPSSWTLLEKNGKALRIKIIQAKMTNIPSSDEKPGLLLKNSDGLLVATKDYYVSIEKIQPEGKHVLSGRDFLSGYIKDIPQYFI